MRPGLAIIKAKFCDLMMEKYFSSISSQSAIVTSRRMSIIGFCHLHSFESWLEAIENIYSMSSPSKSTSNVDSVKLLLGYINIPN